MGILTQSRMANVGVHVRSVFQVLVARCRAWVNKSMLKSVPDVLTSTSHTGYA